MTVLRDIFRAKGRSTLTIMGVAVGVFLTVVVGAMAEKSSMQVDTVDRVHAGRVTVAESGAAMSCFSFSTGGRPLPAGAIELVARVDGVQEVVPQVVLQLDPEAFWMGVPTTIVGGYRHQDLDERASLSDGRLLDDGEPGVVTLGIEVAEQMDAEVGATVALRSTEFEVVGVLARTGITALDQSAFVSLEDARGLFAASVDEMYRGNLRRTPVVSRAEVIVAEGVDADELAVRIAGAVDGVGAFGPEAMKRQSAGTTSTYDSLVLAVGAIALLGGGLSVVNTMVLAATERTREVGIKRALGASRAQIIRDVLWESAVMGAIGGIVGAAAGAVGAALIGRVVADSSGVGLFAVTPRLLLGAAGFAVGIGLVGGIYPARYAARLDPIDALTHS